MKKVCCYCRRKYGDVPDDPPSLNTKGLVSHGICPDCVPRANAEVDAAIAKRKAERPDSCVDCMSEVLRLDDCTGCPDYD